MPGVQLPRVHLNGTSRQELHRQNRAAMDAAADLVKALSEAVPNGRDYYVIGPDAMAKASAQHRSRIIRAEAIRAELAEIVYSLMG